MRLFPGQLVVLKALKDFGTTDDTGLTVYVHHVADSPMSSSGIRSRRAELVRKGLVSVAGIKRLKSGRNAAIYGITPLGKQELRVQTRKLRTKADVV